MGTGFFGGLWRFGGFQNFIVDTAANCCFITLTGVGFMPMMSTPNHFDEGVPPKTRILLGIKGGIALSLALILVLTLTQFDLRWLVEKLRPSSTGGHRSEADYDRPRHRLPFTNPQSSHLEPPGSGRGGFFVRRASRNVARAQLDHAAVINARIWPYSIRDKSVNGRMVAVSGANDS